MTTDLKPPPHCPCDIRVDGNQFAVDVGPCVVRILAPGVENDCLNPADADDEAVNPLDVVLNANVDLGTLTPPGEAFPDISGPQPNQDISQESCIPSGFIFNPTR